MKWYDYSLLIIIIILLVIILLTERKETTVYRVERDTTIVKLLDTVIKLEKTYYNEKTKLYYEQKTDSIFIHSLPSDSLFSDILSRARRILSSGFLDTNRSSSIQMRKEFDTNKEARGTDTTIQSFNRFINESSQSTTNSHREATNRVAPCGINYSRESTVKLDNLLNNSR